MNIVWHIGIENADGVGCMVRKKGKRTKKWAKAHRRSIIGWSKLCRFACDFRVKCEIKIISLSVCVPVCGVCVCLSDRSVFCPSAPLPLPFLSFPWLRYGHWRKRERHRNNLLPSHRLRGSAQVQSISHIITYKYKRSFFWSLFLFSFLVFFCRPLFSVLFTIHTHIHTYTHTLPSPTHALSLCTFLFILLLLTFLLSFSFFCTFKHYTSSFMT